MQILVMINKIANTNALVLLFFSPGVVCSSYKFIVLRLTPFSLAHTHTQSKMPNSSVSTSSSASIEFFQGTRLHKSTAVFMSQIVLIYIVVITCIVNLSLNNENSSLWISLLSAATGYLLPNPSIKRSPVHVNAV